MAMHDPEMPSGEAERRALLAAIVRSSDDAIISTNLDGVITSWSRGAERLYGYAADEAIGQPISIIIPEDRADEVGTILEKIRRGERVGHYETVRRTRDGRRVDISRTVSPIEDEEGRVVGASAVGRDITQRKQVERAAARARAETEERLRASESEARVRSEQLETLVRQAPFGVYFVDADLRIRSVNPIAERVFADFPDSAVGQDFAHVLNTIWGPERAEEILGIARHTLETGEAYHDPEFAERRADRDVVEYYDWRLERIPLPDGRHGLVCYFTDITLRVNARLAIAESEQRYRTLFESISEGFCVIEVLFDEDDRPVDYRFIETNPAFERHTGLIDAAGRTAQEMIPGLERRWVELYGRVASTGEPARFVENSEAMGRWFEVEAFRVGAPEDRRVGLLFADITERRRALREFRASERRERERADELAALMDSVPAVVLLAHDREARKLTGSRKAHDVFRIPPDETFSLGAGEPGEPVPFRIFQDGEEVPAGELPVQRAARGELVQGEQFEVRFDDGESVHLFGNAIPLEGGDGEPRGALAALIDITDRERAEQRLRSSAERLRLARAAARLGIHDYEVRTGRIGWDARTRELWGLGPDEPVTYDVWLSGVHADDREAAEAAVRSAIDPDGDGIYFAEYRVVNRKDGITRWVEATGQTTFENGEAVRMVGTVQDVTEEKEARAALEEADRRKDEFLATLAHELRNPLGAIRAATTAMTEAGDDPDILENMTHVIERQSAYLVRLIDDLMDVSRISLGRINLTPEDLDLVAVVRQVVADSALRFHQKGVALEADLPDEPVRIVADRVRITQVVNNLRDNALKFTPPEGQVRIGVERDGERAVIRVEDTGVGMTPEKISEAFEMFTQLEASGTMPGGALGASGLGIGLSLAKTIVDMHEGAIEAKSDGPGRGSEFVVRLPLAATDAAIADDEARPGDEARAAPEADGEAEPPAGLRIVVAEDHRDARDVVTMMLRMKGHEVEPAKDGLEALEMLRSQRPDAALLDIGMPGMDGYQVARAVREEPWGRNMLLVAMTGWGRDSDKARATEAGFDMHLTKPINLRALDELLRSSAGGPAA